MAKRTNEKLAALKSIVQSVVNAINEIATYALIAFVLLTLCAAKSHSPKDVIKAAIVPADKGICDEHSQQGCWEDVASTWLRLLSSLRDVSLLNSQRKGLCDRSRSNARLVEVPARWIAPTAAKWLGRIVLGSTHGSKIVTGIYVRPTLVGVAFKDSHQLHVRIRYLLHGKSQDFEFDVSGKLLSGSFCE